MTEEHQLIVSQTINPLPLTRPLAPSSFSSTPSSSLSATSTSTILPPACEWAYVGEGNKHIAVRIKNGSLASKILRVKKGHTTTLKSGFTVEDEIGFHSTVVSTLFGPQYMGNMIAVAVTRSFLQELDSKIAASRPEHRKHRTIDLDQSYALLCENHTLFSDQDNISRPSLSIELKPKWGFLRSGSFTFLKHKVKMMTCRFCMHQEWKSYDSPAFVKTDFCPLDLFSLEENRMRAALLSLKECPQNNLRIFLNGARAHDLKNSIDDPSLKRMLRGVDVIDALIKLLERDPILKTLKQHQERLDKFDVEQIIDWFRNLDTSTQDMDPVFRENWNDIVRNYAEGREYALGEIRDTEFFLTAMMEFLISSSLKDCSIIITLRESSSSLSQETGPESYQTIELEGTSFEYKIKLIDVDIKPFSKIPSFYEKDNVISTLYADIPNKKACIP